MLKRLFFSFFALLTVSLQAQIALPIEVFGLPYDIPQSTLDLSGLGLKSEITKVSLQFRSFHS